MIYGIKKCRLIKEDIKDMSKEEAELKRAIYEDSEDVLKDIARGAAIGTACIVPGVSGGTIAIMLKIYDKLYR